MYGWIWRRLPGPLPLRVAAAAVLAALTGLILFLVIFPYVEQRLPYARTTVDRQVDRPAVTSPTPSPSPR